MAKKLYYFKSLDKLKILKFWDIVKDNDFRLLDFDYYEGKKYKRQQLHDLEKTWLRLYDEYYVLTEDRFVINHLEKQMEIATIEKDKSFLKRYYEVLILLKNVAVRAIESEQLVYKQLKEAFPMLDIHYFESIDYNINVVIRTINALTETPTVPLLLKFAHFWPRSFQLVHHDEKRHIR